MDRSTIHGDGDGEQPALAVLRDENLQRLIGAALLPAALAPPPPRPPPPTSSAAPLPSPLPRCTFVVFTAGA